MTQDRFVAVTSNVFAGLGQPALFFLLAALHGRFAYLQQNMSVILGLVGTKMVLSGVVKIPVGLSIAAILIVLAVSVMSSLRVHPGEEIWPNGRVPSELIRSLTWPRPAGSPVRAHHFPSRVHPTLTISSKRKDPRSRGDHAAD